MFTSLKRRLGIFPKRLGGVPGSADANTTLTRLTEAGNKVLLNGEELAVEEVVLFADMGHVHVCVLGEDGSSLHPITIAMDGTLNISVADVVGDYTADNWRVKAVLDMAA